MKKLLLLGLIVVFGNAMPDPFMCKAKTEQAVNILVNIEEKQKYNEDYYYEKKRLKRAYFKLVEYCGKENIKTITIYMEDLGYLTKN